MQVGIITSDSCELLILMSVKILASSVAQQLEQVAVDLEANAAAIDEAIAASTEPIIDAVATLAECDAAV
jgi:hypothetical protein